MSSGKTHDRLTYAALIPIFLTGYLVFNQHPYLVLVFTVGVWLGGIFLSPDLDTRSRPFYRWGPLRFIWWPYQWMARHRSWLSHGLVIAPLLRVFYLGAVIVLGYIGFQIFIIPVMFPAQQAASLPVLQRDIQHYIYTHQSGLFLLILGTGLGSLLHVALDHVSSWLKQK